MPYPDFGLFLPPEEAYSKPGSYTEALRAEGTQRAAYLSTMDQFYAQLEESQRQFDELLPLRVRELDIAEQGVAVQDAAGARSYLLGQEQIASQERLANQQLTSQKQKAAQDAQQSQATLSWLGSMYANRTQPSYSSLQSSDSTSTITTATSQPSSLTINGTSYPTGQSYMDVSSSNYDYYDDFSDVDWTWLYDQLY